MTKNSTSMFERAVSAVALFMLSFVVSPVAFADDTEIYQTSNESGAVGRPKVLIIVDDSGSMSTVVDVGEKLPYDPTATHYADAGFDASRIYWATTSNLPNNYRFTGNYFPASSNRCASSYDPLAQVGKFTGKARQYSACGRQSGGVCSNPLPADWRPLSRRVQDPVHFDCQADEFDPGNSGNGPGQGAGFPNQASSSGDAGPYATTRNNSVGWGSDAYIFYTAHYLDWYYDNSLIVGTKNRLDIVKEVVNSLILSNTGIDFGLAVFNDNSDGYDAITGFDFVNGVFTLATEENTDDDHGGRIISRLQENMTSAQRDALVGPGGIVSGLSHDGFTPLCESTYEVYRYLAGLSPVFGDDADLTNGVASAGGDPAVDAPARDLLAQDASPPGKYISPNASCAYTYVILMTDGYPTYDTEANADIETLTEKTCACYETDETFSADDLDEAYGCVQDAPVQVNQRKRKQSCLPFLAEYMANNDLDKNADNGDQFALTYTIGFATDQQLLADAAEKGKGRYYTAENSTSLTAAFEGAVLSILSESSTYTAPAVAVDTFTRTQSRNEVFFSMFKPSDTLDWPGNIKRLNLAVNNGTAVLVDANGNAGMDVDSGQISAGATTVWTTGADSPDGPTVEKGGVGALLAASDLTARAQRLYSNSGINGALQLFNTTNINSAAYGFDPSNPAGPDAELFDAWDVVDRAHLDEVINWAVGYDVDDADEDNDVTDNRAWLLADSLHSKPLVVNYGARGSFTEANPDLRIVVGTNAGFLHMFGNDDGQEDWAFFAKELGGVLTARKENYASASHVYGIDAPAVVYTKDLNNDGTIDSTVGDMAWLYVGLRRGGNIIYALDISNPDTPSFLWQIDTTKTGFSELGMTFSVPAVSKIPGYYDASGIPKAVLIFGAGYDPNKDSHDTVADDTDTMGRGLYIVDAETGALVWGVTPDDPNSTTNLQESGLIHSVAGTVTPLDSNGDELIDRVYFGDTGGNVWRVDMPNNTLPTASQDTWRIHKLFEANGGTLATDRRFFSAPDVVRTTIAGSSIDAVMLGSGDRTNPADIDDPNDPTKPAVDNQFYMIGDQQVSPYFAAYDASACDPNDPAQDFRCNLPLDPNDLYDVTSNVIQDGTLAEQEVAQAALLDAYGWRLDLGENGEKSLARSLTIAGKVYFTTFSPDPVITNVCEPVPGTGRLYNVGLFDASAVRDFDDDGDFERAWVVGGLIPDTPSPHFGPDGEIRLLLPPGSGSAGSAGNPFETGSELPTPYGSFWYREEY